MICHDYNVSRRQNNYNLSLSSQFSSSTTSHPFKSSSDHFNNYKTSNSANWDRPSLQSSITSKYEERMQTLPTNFISSYPLSRSYTEAHRFESPSRYSAPAPYKYNPPPPTYSTPMLSTARYASPAPMLTTSRYASPAPVLSTSRYSSPAPISTRYSSPSTNLTRYSSPAPLTLTRYSSSQNQSGFSSRRLSDMRPPPPRPRELPPTPPRPLRRHYPLPPPSFPDAMIAVSKRLRNRSASPAPRYADLQIARRPSLVNAALGRETPTRESIRRSLVGSASSSYIYSSSRQL